MDNNVSKIAANANFFIQSKAAKKEKEEAKTEQKPVENLASQAQAKNPDAILDAMQINAMQNKALAFSKLNNPTINPADYLSADRIADIEASMAKFEAGVEDTLEAFDNEFGQTSAWANLSDAAKFSMAAKLQEI